MRSAQLVGVITPGQRIPAHLGNWVSYRDGVPVTVSDAEPVAVAAMAS